MTGQRLSHVFVDEIPANLEEGIFYVSIEFRTTMHLCACGCGNSVVLPLRPAAWALTYNGNSISMSPSIGNWSFDCKSHYWIRDGRVVWAEAWSDKQVQAGRQRTLVERGAIRATGAKPDEAGPRWGRLRAWGARALGVSPRTDAR